MNYLWPQEQCAKQIVPLVKISEKIKTADLMIKHLVGPVLLKHVKNPNLEIREGRSGQAAKLHSVSSTPATQIVEQGSNRKLPGGDFLAERGEHDRWVRVHVRPTSAMFYPEKAPEGQAGRRGSRR